MGEDARFEEAVEIHELINMFDSFHERMTDTMYTQDDEWFKFRQTLLFAKRKCLMEKRKPIYIGD